MKHALKVLARRAAAVAAALAVVVGTAGLALAHDDEDYDEWMASRLVRSTSLP
jgi:hypothetical protein